VVARFDVRQDRYEPGVERIETLSDASELRGSAATIHARGKAPMDVPEDLTREEAEEILRGRFTRDRGDPVRPNLARSSGIVVARDYESFSLLTLYHHLESAEGFLQDAGAEASEVARLDVLYLPEFTQEGAVVVDNFFYVHGARVLGALALDRLGDVPLVQNEGVVAHEVMHCLWDARVLDAEATFRRLEDGTHGEPATDWRAINLLDGTSEGVSDFIGAAVSGDADFIRHSVPEHLQPFPRGIAEPVVLERDWIDGYADTRYRVGTTIASALWRTSEDHALVAEALVAALSDFGARLQVEPPWLDVPASFGPAWLLEPIAGRLDGATRETFCEIVRGELAAIAEHVPACAL